MRLRVLATMILACFTACDSINGPRVCTLIAIEALNVTVLDAGTGQRICDASVTVVDGSFTATLRLAGGGQECTYAGPTERRGVYEVRATRAGYQAGVMRDVRVNADECHVMPVTLTIRLTR